MHPQLIISDVEGPGVSESVLLPPDEPQTPVYAQPTVQPQGQQTYYQQAPHQQGMLTQPEFDS